MKLWKTFWIVSLIAFLSGCTSDLLYPPYEDHPNLAAAEMARNRGDIPQAIHDYRDIIKECPFCEKAYIGLGLSLLDANEIDEAKKTFEKALALFPKSIGAHTGLGFFYLVIDQPENAIACFDRALALNPRYAKALNGEGIALDMIGDYAGAQCNYRAAMETDPTNISFQSNLALSMALAGNFSEAIHILERLVHSPKANPRVRQNLALAYGLAGDLNMAKKIGKIDLSEDWVRNNISYFQAIQKTKEHVGLAPKNHSIPLVEARKWQEGG